MLQYFIGLDSRTRLFPIVLLLLLGNVDLLSANHRPHKGPNRPRPIRSRALTEAEYKITCSAATYADGMTCADGKMPPNVSSIKETQDYIEKTALWDSPDNAPTLEKVKDIAENCSISCQNGACYYSLKNLDYICGSPSSKEYSEAHNALKKVANKHFDFTRYPNNMICWNSPKMKGQMYDPLKINQADQQMAEWYKHKVTKLELLEVQVGPNGLSTACRTKRCQYYFKKASFVCASLSGGIRLVPISLPILLWLELCLGFIFFWKDYSILQILYNKLISNI